jgi:glycerol-3-phosphate acyltransferase PlsY
MRDALVLGGAYLLGSIPSAWLVSYASGVGDIRRVGSGNVGATNVLRTSGVVPAIVTLILDIGKGAAAVWAARRAGMPDDAAAAAGLLAIAGHVFPVWLRFRGGKGVATAAGVFALLAPLACVAGAAVFVMTIAATRYVSLASVLGTIAMVVAAIAVGYPRATVFVAVAAAALIVARHADNVGRLRTGAEPRLGRGST